MAEKLFDDAKYHKLGILGGTFNPIHIGHLLLAEAALAEAGLDGVMFLPSGYSYMKDSDEILPAEERLTITKLAISEQPAFFASDMEIKREGNTYTYETLSTIKAMHPDTELYFIMGADCLFTIESWKCPDMIFGTCTLIAAVRDDVDMEELKKQAEKLKQKYDAKIILLPFLKTEISSTTIRERMKQGKSIRYMVPSAVRTYLEERNFYR